MTNDSLNRLINRINFELANNFELAVAKEYSFVPINIQGGSFFVATTSESDRDKISEYIKPIIDKNIEFVFLTKQSFDVLFDGFLRKFSSTHDSVISSSTAQNPFGDVTFDQKNSDTSKGEAKQKPKTDEEVDLEIDDNVDLSIEDDEELLDLDEEHEEPALKKPAPKKISENVKSLVGIESVQAPNTKKIGQILIEEGLINEKQLNMALAESKASGIPLGSELVKMGFISVKDLKDALAAQMGVTLATSEQLKALPTAISILPEEFVRENKVIPLSMTDKSLVVGMVDPGNLKAIDEIIYQTGIKPTVMMVTHFEYEAFLQTYYENEKEAANKILEEIERDRDDIGNDGTLWEQVENEIQDTSGTVAKLANKIVTLAIDQKASDIHIEPRSAGYIVRLRIDGTLREILKIPEKVDTAVVSRFKVLARMNIAEHRRAQDGNFSIKYKKNTYDFRINTLPVAGKEKMVIRVLAPAINDVSEKKKSVDISGVSPEDLKKIEYLVSSPNGIVLTSGPTGSGKTSTLYSLLRALNSEDVNITTIEDPIEIRMEGVNQSAVNHKAGITFVNCLRAILRQDPDIILVGEIRDFETLEVAISASLTGHLVLSTIHTNSAAATITRLIEMGAKDYLVSSTVTGVIAQRLVKRLCPECKEAYKPSLEEAKKILTDPAEIQKLTETTIYRAKGCPYCNDTGYKGRTGVFEIMVITKEMKKMIAQRAHDVELEEYAIRNGMKTLKMSCVDHILNGITTIDEFVRILGLASEQ